MSMSRIPSSSLATVCFWHQRTSQGVTAGWASDVKHVCFLAFWRPNQAEGERLLLELHLFYEISQGYISSLLDKHEFYIQGKAVLCKFVGK